MTTIPDTITAVLFDWDFTLAYTIGEDVTFVERMAFLFQSQGINCTVAECQAAFDQFREDVASGKIRGVVTPQTRRQILANYRHIMQRLGYEQPDETLIYRLYSGYANLPHYLYGDVLPALNALRQAGLTLGILSNHSISVRPTIDRLVGAYIPSQNVTVSEAVGVHKPGKTIFRRAAARLRTPPQNCLYVGDNLTVDALGAVQQGGYGAGLWLDRRQQGTVTTLPPRVGRLTTLADLPPILPSRK